MNSIPSILQKAHNEKVLSFLKGKSCHGDIAERLNNYLSKYEDVYFYCLDPANFRYTCWYIGNRIVAFAVGMESIYLRIKSTQVNDILDLRASSFEELGKDWYEVEWNSANLEQLVEWAYTSAKEL